MKTTRLLSFGVAALGLISPVVHALPVLQLDIDGGVYTGGSEQSTVAQSSQFNVVALVSEIPPVNPYYLSVAVIPKETPDSANFGSFWINGVEYKNANTAYGTPPLEEIYTSELATHGVFPTQFIEIPFNFINDAAHTIAAYNVQDNTSGPGNLLFLKFAVDTRFLDADYKIHFDLYDIDVKNKKTGVVSGQDFAPFSHDAVSGPGGGLPPDEVPDAGGTALLVGLGAVGLFFGRGIRKA